MSTRVRSRPTVKPVKHTRVGVVPVVQPQLLAPALDLSQRAYWLFAAAIVVGYLLLWLTHFQYVYGAIVDDYFIWYTKGLKTLADWRNAFGAYTTQMNFAQMYAFIISYLPLKSGISLPSYPLPLMGEQTGQ